MNFIGGGGGGGGAVSAGGRGTVTRVNDTEAIERVRKAREAEMRAFLDKKDLAAGERKKIEEELRASEQRVCLLHNAL